MKPKLPKNIQQQDNDSIRKLQQKLNHYLIELCKNPKKEFIKFLSHQEYGDNTENLPYFVPSLPNNIDSMSRVSSSEILVPEKAIEQTAQNTQNALNYLRHLWCCERLVSVDVKLCLASFSTDIKYIIQISYKETRFNSEKNIMEITDFYNRLKTVFKDTPIPNFPDISDPTLLKKDDLNKIRNWFEFILNDADLLYSDAQRFFGCDFMNTFPYIYQMNRIHYRQQKILQTMQEKLGVHVKAKVPSYKLEFDENSKNLQMTFRIEIEIIVEENNFEPTKRNSWQITKKYFSLLKCMKKGI